MAVSPPPKFGRDGLLPPPQLAPSHSTSAASHPGFLLNFPLTSYCGKLSRKLVGSSNQDPRLAPTASSPIW